MTTAVVDPTAPVLDALTTVHDPEYPGISIVDMGMVGAVGVTDGVVLVELVPTFSGCPALAFIEADVRAAVGALDGVEAVEVTTSRTIVWDTSRLTVRARAAMAADFTVAVADPGRATTCPRCRARSLVEVSAFGPTRCRAVHRCRACGETVEVMRA